jgi:hypothetical protein
MNKLEIQDKVESMSALSVGVISFLVGALVSGGGIYTIDKRNQKNEEEVSEVITAISQLESKVDQAKAQAITNLTTPDLLKVPCSAEYLATNGTMLCREMFCRMNRQHGEGASGKECDEISNMANSLLIIDACMKYWDESTKNERGALDQNSKYAQCVQLFANRK